MKPAPGRSLAASDRSRQDAGATAMASQAASQADADGGSKTSPNTFDATIRRNADRMIEEGQRIFRYDTFGRNPVTGTIGTQWICTSAADQARRWTESRSGDVLQLKGRGPSIPFVLSPDRTSLSALAARMGISLKATGCAARTS